jgi:hypothetical protein
MGWIVNVGVFGISVALLVGVPFLEGVGLGRIFVLVSVKLGSGEQEVKANRRMQKKMICLLNI